MPLSQEQKDEIIDLRVTQKMSMTDISEKLGIHTEIIRRVLVRAGVHSPKKFQRPEDVAKNVNKKDLIITRPVDISDYKLEKSYERHQKSGKIRLWHQRSPEEKAEFEVNRVAKLKEAVKLGSKMERYMCGKLASRYTVIPKAENFVPGTACHVDILLPDEKIAIEVDGLTHYSNIYNDQDRRMETDALKNEILMGAGYFVIRAVNEKEFALWYGEVLCKRVFDEISRVRQIGVDRIPRHQRLSYITSGVDIIVNKHDLMEYLRERKLGPFKDGRNQAEYPKEN